MSIFVFIVVFILWILFLVVLARVLYHFFQSHFIEEKEECTSDDKAINMLQSKDNLVPSTSGLRFECIKTGMMNRWVLATRSSVRLAQGNVLDSGGECGIFEQEKIEYSEFLE